MTLLSCYLVNGLMLYHEVIRDAFDSLTLSRKTYLYAVIQTDFHVQLSINNTGFSLEPRFTRHMVKSFHSKSTKYKYARCAIDFRDYETWVDKCPRQLEFRQTNESAGNTGLMAIGWQPFIVKNKLAKVEMRMFPVNRGQIFGEIQRYEPCLHCININALMSAVSWEGFLFWY